MIKKNDVQREQSPDKITIHFLIWLEIAIFCKSILSILAKKR